MVYFINSASSKLYPSMKHYPSFTVYFKHPVILFVSWLDVFLWLFSFPALVWKEINLSFSYITLKLWTLWNMGVYTNLFFKLNSELADISSFFIYFKFLAFNYTEQWCSDRKHLDHTKIWWCPLFQSYVTEWHIFCSHTKTGKDFVKNDKAPSRLDYMTEQDQINSQRWIIVYARKF